MLVILLNIWCILLSTLKQIEKAQRIKSHVINGTCNIYAGYQTLQYFANFQISNPNLLSNVIVLMHKIFTRKIFMYRIFL